MTKAPSLRPSTKILTDRRLLELPDPTQLVVKAARREGVSPFRLMREIAALTMRRGGITAHEYFGYHLYRKDLPLAGKRAFVGEKGNYRLNLRMSPPGLTEMRGFLRDKVLATSLWRQLGLPTTTTRAMFTPDRWLGPVRTLPDAAAIEAYLRAATELPLFGKPVNGIQALGSVRIEAIDSAAGTARLGNGREVSVAELAQEIVRDFPEGYMFQDVVVQHPEITAIFGPALSCPRLTTVIPEDGPELLYAYWKIAAFDGMSDNFWQPGSLLADLDPATGEIRRCITGKGPEVSEVAEHPVTGRQVVGYRIPFWQEALELVKKAHAIYPVNGVLGWDVAFTADGPVLVECNENPGHDTYQIVTGRGMNAPEFKAVTDRVAARSAALFQGRRARVYKIKH